MAAQVLIVGAGPTGLVLALRLARHGVAVRIIDAASGPAQTSRAMIVHARTLEYYRQLGFAAQVVDAGVRIAALHLREGEGKGDEAAAGAETGVTTLALDDIGRELTPYPFLLACPQDRHERLLREQLHAAGVAVEWNTALELVEQDEWGVRATLLKDGQRINASAAWLCGCDGAHSHLRQLLGIGFSASGSDQLYYMADVLTSATAGPQELLVHLGADSVAAVAPMPAMHGETPTIAAPPAQPALSARRLMGIAAADSNPNLIFDDVRAALEARLGLAITHVSWFSTYRVQPSVATRLRHERCFLVGDAAHVHSPAGGQGMNTGIGDAINLAWKLAQVVHGQADVRLLDTYEAERQAYAHTLLASTDRGIALVAAQGTGGRLLRHWLVPHVLPAVAGFDAARRALFKTLSQLQVHYPDSALAGGRAGEIIGGDRLPWVTMADGQPDDTPLQTLDWQLHVYGAVAPALAAEAQALGLTLHAWPWSATAHAAGLLEDAAYLVRPDMHVALALPRQEIDTLRDMVAQFGLRLDRNAAATSDGGHGHLRPDPI